MVPSAGSAYAYAYAALGEAIAWMIGWDLLLEYAGGRGDGGGLLVELPAARCCMAGASSCRTAIAAAPAAGGMANLPAMAIIVVLSLVLIGGVSESAKAQCGDHRAEARRGGRGRSAWARSTSSRRTTARSSRPTPASSAAFGWSGILRGAAVVFFAYLGFDAVSTAAAEAERPQRTIPIGILGSLAVCTVLYLAFAVGPGRHGQLHEDARRRLAGRDRHRADAVRLAAGRW